MSLKLDELISMPWPNLTYVGFDTETTGKYPLESEICELAAVKWRQGRIVERFTTLLKPSRPMGPEVMAIHGITNEMVENAPRVRDKIGEFHAFIQDAVLVAHHAPFDLGFISVAFEAAGLPLPSEPVLCSSLLARRLFPESENHRLQTLIRFFQLPQGAAHRALDDAEACLGVGLRCLEKLGPVPIGRAFEVQGGALTWDRFSLRGVENAPIGKALLQAIRERAVVEICYGSGSTPGAIRRVHPLSLVRSLDGDYLVAYAEAEQRSKRYLLERIKSIVSTGS